MTTAQYFKHIRSLAAFPAAEAIELARQAAELDASRRDNIPPAIVSTECLPDGSGMVHLSFGIKVY